MENFYDSKIYAYTGDSVAYLDTGSGLAGALVEYNIKFFPVGEILDQCAADIGTQPLGENDFVFITPPTACKIATLDFLSELIRRIEDEGLYVGARVTYDTYNPFHLYDHGNRIVGIRETELERADP